MSRRSEAMLWGCVRLVGTPDSIGIPVFSAPGSNQLWVPETDGDFRITRFLVLPPDAGFVTVNEVPGNLKRWFALGDYSPLPFWIAGKILSVAGNAYPEEVPDVGQLSEDARSVVTDVRQLLDDARNGRFKLKFQEDEAERIATAFPDVFEEAPVHSKYWVSRYRVAAAQARADTKPPHPIDARLLSVGRDWLQRFGSKTDYPRMKALLGKDIDGVFSGAEIKNLYFAYIIDRIQRRYIPEIVRWVLRDKEFISLFPTGIYGFFIENGWPNSPFEYARPANVLDPLREAISKAIGKPDVLGALRGLAHLYFGSDEAPQDFNRFLLPFRQSLVQALQEARETILEIERGPERIPNLRYLEAAMRLVDSFDSLRFLEGVEYPDGRLRDLRKPIRNISPELVDQLRPFKSELAEARRREREQMQIVDKRYAKYEWDEEDYLDEDEEEPPSIVEGER